jgi:hypothetical protein
MISALNKLSLSSDQLDDRFGLTLDQSAAVSKATGLTGDALAQYISQLGDLAYGYNTSEAVLEKAKKRLEETYGGSLPKDIDAFDAKIKAIDKTTQGGIELTAKLLGMRSDFIAYNDAIKQFNSTLVDSATILGLIEQNSNLYSDAASFNTAKALAGQGVNAIYNSSDASQNGRIMIDELVKLRTSIAYLIEEAKKTNDNTLTTARTLLQVTDGVTLLTSTA